MKIINMRKTGQRIYELRTKRGLSVRDVQAAVGLAVPQAIYKWENGECLPKIDHVVILLDALGVEKIEDILVIEDVDI